VDLMRVDPELLRDVTDCLTYLNARESVPRLKEASLSIKDAGVRRLLDAVIIRLDTPSPEDRVKVVKIVSEHVRDYEKSVRWGSQALGILTHVAFRANATKDSRMMLEAFKACGPLPVDVRAELIRNVLVYLGMDYVVFMKFLSELSDEELTAMFKASPGCWSMVKDDLAVWAGEEGRKPSADQKERLAIDAKLRAAHEKAVAP
jgi:hypothetical protein